MYSKTNLANYLLKLDLINKLQLKSVIHCPEVDRVIIQFSTKQFTNYIRPEVVSFEKDLRNQINSVLFYNLCIGVNPKVHTYVEKSAVENNVTKASFRYFINKVVLRSRSDIDKFIFYLFVENNFIQEINSLEDLKLIEIKRPADGKTISIKLPVSFSIFNDLAEYCNFTLKDTSIKNLHFNITFRIKNCEYLNGSDFNTIFPFRNIKV